MRPKINQLYGDKLLPPLASSFTPPVLPRDPWQRVRLSIRIVIISFLAVLAIGCKLGIAVPEGGVVVSHSGAYHCESGQACEIDVSDIFFDETFTGRPEEGYFFRKWKRVDRGFCANEFDDCRLATEGFESSETLMNFLESGDIYFLKPVFTKGSCSLKSDEETDVFDSRAYVYSSEWQECTSPDQPGPVKHGQELHFEDGRVVLVNLWDLGEILQTTSYYENGNKKIEYIRDQNDPSLVLVKQYNEAGELISAETK